MRICFGSCLVSIASLFLFSLTGCGGDEAARSDSAANTKGKSSDTAAETIVNSIGMKLVPVPAGEFLMGSSDTDPGGREDEKPQHRVKITQPFLMGVYEVTQGEFQSVMELNTSFFSNEGPVKDSLKEFDCSRFPVDGITWYQAAEFCRKLSELPAEKSANRVYRLPFEAEWEYACRAGTKTVFHYGDTLSSTQANFKGVHPFGDVEQGPFLSRTTTVGSYKPNAFGLYDMHGSLNEWCMDKFQRDYYKKSPPKNPTGPPIGTSRVIRGGDWYSDARDCRSAFRYADIPDGTFYALGFRVVCLPASVGTGVPANFSDPVEPSGKPLASITTSSEQPQYSAGEDWPRWRGPRADGTWLGPKIASAWPKEGLQRAWRQEIGGGYGGVSVSGGRVYLMDRLEKPNEVERVLCFDAVNGKPLWSRSYPVDYKDVSYGNGPRATPTVFRGQIYTLGTVGNLMCLNAVNGETVWSKNLVKEFSSKIPIWGLSASPVIFEDLVIVHAGSEPDGCYLAFDLNTGEERWRSLSDPAGYATPILIDREGTAELVCWTPNNVCGLDPRTGELHWAVPFEVNYGSSVAYPIFQKGTVLVSSYYDGSKAIRLGAKLDDAKEVWHDRRNLRGLMAQPLYRDGHGYLIDKRHGLTCFKLETGEKIWDDDNRMTPKGRNPQATMVWLNDKKRAIVLNSDGDLLLIQPNINGYVEETRANIIGRTWAHPAYAGNCVYARSDTEIVCVILPQEKQ